MTMGHELKNIFLTFLLLHKLLHRLFQVGGFLVDVALLHPVNAKIHEHIRMLAVALGEPLETKRVRTLCLDNIGIQFHSLPDCGTRQEPGALCFDQISEILTGRCSSRDFLAALARTTLMRPA